MEFNELNHEQQQRQEDVNTQLEELKQQVKQLTFQLQQNNKKLPTSSTPHVNKSSSKTTSPIVKREIEFDDDDINNDFDFIESKTSPATINNTDVKVKTESDGTNSGDSEITMKSMLEDTWTLPPVTPLNKKLTIPPTLPTLGNSVNEMNLRKWKKEVKNILSATNLWSYIKHGYEQVILYTTNCNRSAK